MSENTTTPNQIATNHDYPILRRMRLRRDSLRMHG